MTIRIPCLFQASLSIYVGLLLGALCLPLAAPSPVLAEDTVSIDWLQKDMSCDDLTREMKERYAKAGGYSALSDVKKEELGLVLDIICGARFEKCGFKNCKKIAPAALPKRTKDVIIPTAFDTQAEAKRVFDERVAKQEEALRKGIAEAQAKEAAEKLGWTRVSIPFEASTEVEVEEEPESDAAPAPTAPEGKKKEPPRTDATRARGRVRTDFVGAASPATPMIDLEGVSVRPDGAPKRGSYLSKADPRYHQFEIATVPVKLSLPGAGNP